MVRVPTNRQPTHPGEVLREDFLVPMGIKQQALADAIHVPNPQLLAELPLNSAWSCGLRQTLL